MKIPPSFRRHTLFSLSVASMLLSTACGQKESTTVIEEEQPVVAIDSPLNVESATASLAALSDSTSGNAATDSPSSEDAGAAWVELVRASSPPVPPASWQESQPTETEIEAFREDAIERIRHAVTLATQYVENYPEDRNANAARIKERDLLSMLQQLGDNSMGERLTTVSRTLLEDGDLTDDQRFEARFQILQQQAMPLQSDPLALSELIGTNVLEMKEEFPGNQNINSLMFQAYGLSMSAKNEAMAARLEVELLDTFKESVAQNPDDPTSYYIPLNIASTLASAGEFEKYEKVLALIPSEGVPEQVGGMIDNVRAMVEGERAKFDRIGKPVDLAFTAIDGREVDLSQLKGKVVLLDFWATWCGPCIVALPKVKVAYEKYHSKGFEIVGISLDEELDSLKQFIAKQDMPWPQYYDGKGWSNDIARRFGISAIPAMWLIDREGNLRHLEVRADLIEMVAALLDEPI